MSTTKHKARELAMQVLFLWDAQGDADVALAEQAGDATADAGLRQRALTMAQAAWAGREISDRWVERLAPQWPPRRQPGVDRNILRLAVWELTGASTPPKVVIDEAIELAREYSTENSPAFVNGVLDAVLREKNALMASQLPAAEAAGSAELAAQKTSEAAEAQNSHGASPVKPSQSSDHF